MNFIKPITVFLFTLICTNSFSQITEKHYKIFSVKQNKEIKIEEIANDMANFDVLFFGEEHNDSVTHFLEQKMFELLFQKFSANTTLSLEMFDRDVQTTMNEYLKGDIRERNFLKDARVWNNYRDYKPMVELAKANRLDVVCANAAGRYTNLVGRKGQEALMALTEESKENFAPLPYDTASGKYYEKLMALTSHSSSTDTSKKTMPAMGAFNLILSQSLWDATMAYSIAEYWKHHKQNKIMHVNGRFHSDEGFAVVTQLKKYKSKIKSLIISTGTDESFPNIDWSKYLHLGDYIILTDPSVPKTYK